MHEQTTARITTLVTLFVLSIMPGGLRGADGQDLDHPVPGDIIITELMVDPASVGDTDGEYIELYNRTSADIDLEGWILMDAGSDDHVISNGGPLLIGAESYLVLARNADPAENGGFEADYQYSSYILSNQEDEVVLLTPEGEVIDSLRYRDDLGFPLEAGAALELRNPYWNNAMGVTWRTAEVPFGDGDLGTPGFGNSVQEPFTMVAVDAGPSMQTVPPGDSLVVSVCLFNPTWLDWTCDAASFLVMPGGKPYCHNPLDGPFGCRLEAGRVIEARRAYLVPDYAPPGIYELYYGVRGPDGDALDSEMIRFEVSALRVK